MEPPVYQRKYEALKRALKRLDEYYLGKIDNIDSFNGPKDFVYTYFHCAYSLKEALRNVDGLRVENFVYNNNSVALGLDISNTEKHGKLNKPKTDHLIGKINSSIHIFDPSGRKDRTELSIEIDGIKTDCLELAQKNFTYWKQFLVDNNLLEMS